MVDPLSSDRSGQQLPEATAASCPDDQQVGGLAKTDEYLDWVPGAQFHLHVLWRGLSVQGLVDLCLEHLCGALSCWFVHHRCGLGTHVFGDEGQLPHLDDQQRAAAESALLDREPERIDRVGRSVDAHYDAAHPALRSSPAAQISVRALLPRRHRPPCLLHPPRASGPCVAVSVRSAGQAIVAPWSSAAQVLTWDQLEQA
jgi:hypothetical protein